VVTFVTGVGGAAVLHPTECRKLSLNEVRRLCGFPDDFVLTGSYAQGGERLARAVPPVMMAHIAAAVRDEVLARTREAAA
jgi:DNA (cytosine-5)-methyltransferase 1